jgi:site-specific recombinase XerD
MANYADATRTPRTLTEREQRALLKVTGEHRAGFRDHVLYAMALGTGLREHEFIALSVLPSGLKSYRNASLMS